MQSEERVLTMTSDSSSYIEGVVSVRVLWLGETS